MNMWIKDTGVGLGILLAGGVVGYFIGRGSVDTPPVPTPDMCTQVTITSPMFIEGVTSIRLDTLANGVQVSLMYELPSDWENEWDSLHAEGK